MAQGDIVFYNNFKEALLAKDAPDLNDAGITIKVALVTAYTPDYDVHDFWDDVVATELSHASYTTGGIAIANKAVTQDNVDNEGVWDGDDVVFPSLAAAAGTPNFGVIYYSTGVNSTSMLIGTVELGLAPNGSNYTITWATEGIANLV